MGLFGKKAAGEPEVVFERERAAPITNVQNLQANLVSVAAKIGWADRSQPSPVMQASLQPGVDTYGHERVGIYVGKTCVGFFGGPSGRGVTATRAAVVFEQPSLIIGFVCPEAPTM